MKFGIFATLFISVAAIAASGGHDAAEAGVPRVVLWQAVNISILLGVLVYFMKDKVRAYYTGKRENYLRVAREVADLKRQVQEQATILKDKIRKLDETADQQQKKAELDAREFNTKLLVEAREQAEKLKRETEKTVSAEIYRAVEALKSEVVDKSISTENNAQRPHHFNFKNLHMEVKQSK